jgi:hypothetical protein
VFGGVKVILMKGFMNEWWKERESIGMGIHKLMVVGGVVMSGYSIYYRFYGYIVVQLLICMIDLCLRMNYGSFLKTSIPPKFFFNLFFPIFIYLLQFIDCYYVELWRLKSD